MTKNQVAWLATPIIIVLAIGLTLVASGSEDPANGAQAFDIVLAEGESQVIEVAPAGTVTLTRTRSHLELAAADASPGYLARIRVREAAGQHVQADFTGEDRRFTFRALLYEGRVRITVDQEQISEPTTSTTEVTRTSLVATTTLSTTTTTTATTIPTPIAPATTAPPTTTAPSATTSPPTSAPTTTAPTTTAPPTTTTLPPSTTTLIPTLPDSEITYPLGPAGTVDVKFREGEFDDVDLDLARDWDVVHAQASGDRIDLLIERRDQRVIWQAFIDQGVVVVNLQVIEDVDG